MFSYLKNLTIKTKIIAMVALALVALSGMAVSGYQGMASAKKHLNAQVNHEIENQRRIFTMQEGIRYLLNADRDAHQAHIAEIRALNSASAEAYAGAKASNAENLEQTVTRTGKASAAFDDHMNALYAEFQTSFDAWQTASRAVVEAAQDPAARDALAEAHAESTALFSETRDYIDQIEVAIEDNIAAFAEQEAAVRAEVQAETDAMLASLNLVQIGIAVCTMLVTVLFASVICRSILVPFKQLMQGIETIDQTNDLTLNVDVQSKDELGQLGSRFNQFVETLRDILEMVKAASNEVATASTEVATVSEQLASGIQTQTGQINEISAAIEEMSCSVVQVADQATGASENAKHSGQTAETGSDAVSQTVTGINAIEEAVNVSAQSVQDLGARGEEIGQLITVINDIADQTNLLALNAAIEAARAGEHGRGFAVVADEVRKLADRTGAATEEIAGSIQAIQTGTTEAVTRMETGTQKVQEGVTAANEARGHLANIVDASTELSQKVESIAAAAEQQSAAANQIASNIEGIRAISSQNHDGTAQASMTAHQLSEKAEQLQGLASRFKTA